MDDAQSLFSQSGAADDETKRHNNLRKDILTSLLEVDQTIKGLEHRLAGRIQQIEDGLHAAPSAAPATAAAPTPRSAFYPAATTPSASKILQENISPLSSDRTPPNYLLPCLRE